MKQLAKAMKHKLVDEHLGLSWRDVGQTITIMVVAGTLIALTVIYWR